MITERYYRFAGLDVVVAVPEEISNSDDRRLGPFAANWITTPHIFRFTKIDVLTEPKGELVTVQPNFSIYSEGSGIVRYIGPVSDSWEDAYIRAEHIERIHNIQLKAEKYPGRIGTKTILESMAVEHLIARNNGFIFHCSYIDYNGRAILFTAPSETGKSTQAELWNRYRSTEIINGDRAAVRLVNGDLIAEGIPFAGSSKDCKNRSLPIEAIVYLGQAPQTTIRKMRGYEAFSKIWEGVSVNTWDKEDMELVSSVVQQIAERIPVYHMPCTPDESAVIALEQALRK